MKYVYAMIAIIVIFVISIFTFYDDFIFYNYAKFTIEKEEKVMKNLYYYEDDFSYINNYEDLEIHNKDELYETFYYIINSGVTYTKRYFSIDYTDFRKDYEEFFSESNKAKLNAINNFVHPYNSFISIRGKLKGYSLEIFIKYKYGENERNLIENKVNEITSNLINNKMNDKEKIKTIHDYIINNTVYDKDFCVEHDEVKCETTSPYKSDVAYGVLFEHYGICSGYTDVIAIFLNKLGITNYRVTNDSHTWNAVKLDGKWYHLDATWDDPISEREILSHAYFLITTSQDNSLKESHSFNKEIFAELN